MVLAASSSYATVIDLTTLGPGGAQVCVDINDGARVCNTDTNSGAVGQGTFPAFLASGGGEGPVYQHYNTEGSVSSPDNEAGNGANQNEPVLLSSLGLANGFAVFRLDINQQGNDPLLSIPEISVFLGNGSLSGYDDATGRLGGVDPLWSLTNGDWINLDYSLAAGSGNGVDMYLLLPQALFVGQGSSTNLQLFARYGRTESPTDPLSHSNNDGGEEWSYLRCETQGASCIPRLDPPPVPAPAPLALLGAGLIGLGFARRRSATVA